MDSPTPRIAAVHSHSKDRRAILVIVIIAALAILAVVLFGSGKAQAATTPDTTMHGYAWSSTIGWVSLNCAEGTATGTSVCTTSNYAVNVDPTSKAITGYAWSSNVGWISFYPADTSSCGTAASINSSNALVGWARVISGTVASGADGCISLSGASPAYGVTYDPVAGTITGYAWGSTNVGWLQFNGTLTLTPPVSTPAVLLTATPTAVTSGTTTPVTLTWNTQYMANASACTGSSSPSVAAWNGTHSSSIGAATNATSVIPLTLSSVPEVFTISCMPAGGGPALTSSVPVLINVPSCAVTPAAASEAPAAGTINGTSSFQVAWSYISGYPTTTVSIGSVTPGAPGVAATLSGGTLSSASSSATVTTSGPFTATTPAQTVQVSASGTAAGALVNCAPATLTMSNTTAAPPKSHLPWYEF